MKRKKKQRLWSWEKIAIELYESMGCACCSQYGRMMKAKDQYRMRMAAIKREAK